MIIIALIVAQHLQHLWLNKSSDKLILEEFELASVQWAIYEFPRDENVGPISSAEDAAEKAKAMWMREIYAEYDSWEEANGRPIVVAYDENNDCWYIWNSTPKKKHYWRSPQSVSSL